MLPPRRSRRWARGASPGASAGGERTPKTSIHACICAARAQPLDMAGREARTNQARPVAACPRQGMVTVAATLASLESGKPRDVSRGPEHGLDGADSLVASPGAAHRRGQ